MTAHNSALLYLSHHAHSHSASCDLGMSVPFFFLRWVASAAGSRAMVGLARAEVVGRPESSVRYGRCSFQRSRFIGALHLMQCALCNDCADAYSGRRPSSPTLVISCHRSVSARAVEECDWASAWRTSSTTPRKAYSTLLSRFLERCDVISPPCCRR